MRRQYRIAVAEDGYVAQVRKLGRWKPVYGGSRWGSVGGSLDGAEALISRHIVEFPPRDGHIIHRQIMPGEKPSAIIHQFQSGLKRPQTGELAQRIHVLIMEYEGDIGLAEAIGALEVAKHTILSTELINKISGQ